MKALLLIDPVAQTITEAEYDGDSRNIALLLSDAERCIKCSTFTAIYPVDGLTIFVDNNGLLNEPKYFFRYEGYAQPIAGRGLVPGANREGASVAATLTIDDLKPKITFHGLGVAEACRCRGTRSECNAAA